MEATTGEIKKTENKKISVFLALRYRLMLDVISDLINDEGDLEVVCELTNLVELIDGINKIDFDILILDHEIQNLDVNKIVELNSENKKANILLLIDNNINENFLVSYVKSGIKGYFYKENEAKQLLKSIRVINSGELWVERKLLPKIIDGVDIDLEDRSDLPVYNLTQAEFRIFKLVLNGLTNNQIANQLFISDKTVKFHLYKIFRKLSVKSRSELIIFGFRNGLA